MEIFVVVVVVLLFCRLFVYLFVVQIGNYLIDGEVVVVGVT